MGYGFGFFNNDWTRHHGLLCYMQTLKVVICNQIGLMVTVRPMGLQPRTQGLQIAINDRVRADFLGLFKMAYSSF